MNLNIEMMRKTHWKMCFFCEKIYLHRDMNSIEVIKRCQLQNYCRECECVMKRENSINEQINKLIGKDEIKDFFIEINDVCLKSTPEAKMGIPNLFLVAKHGSGIKYIAEIYAEMMKTYRVFSQRCSRKLLELSYCTGMSKEELLRFVLRVKKYADIQNCYYGTTLIHIEPGVNGEKFQINEREWLLDFLKKNRENMKFVIHISPQIDNYKDFVSRMEQVIPYRTIGLEYLSKDEWTEYLNNELEKVGVCFTDEDKQVIKGIIEELIEKNYFNGYTTMNQLVPIICYEYAAKRIRIPMNEKQAMNLRNLIIHEENREEKNPIGFM